MIWLVQWRHQQLSVSLLRTITNFRLRLPKWTMDSTNGHWELWLLMSIQAHFCTLPLRKLKTNTFLEQFGKSHWMTNHCCILHFLYRFFELVIVIVLGLILPITSTIPNSVYYLQGLDDFDRNIFPGILLSLLSLDRTSHSDVI